MNQKPISKNITFELIETPTGHPLGRFTWYAFPYRTPGDKSDPNIKTTIRYMQNMGAWCPYLNIIMGFASNPFRMANVCDPRQPCVRGNIQLFNINLKDNVPLGNLTINILGIE